MSATELLSRLTSCGITLRAVDDRIQAKPMAAMAVTDREQLHQFKAELLTLLRGSADKFFDERAAIRQFDGKLSRIDAELLAARDCKRPCDCCDTLRLARCSGRWYPSFQLCSVPRGRVRREKRMRLRGRGFSPRDNDHGQHFPRRERLQASSVRSSRRFSTRHPARQGDATRRRVVQGQAGVSALREADGQLTRPRIGAVGVHTGRRSSRQAGRSQSCRTEVQGRRGDAGRVSRRLP